MKYSDYSWYFRCWLWRTGGRDEYMHVKVYLTSLIPYSVAYIPYASIRVLRNWFITLKNGQMRLAFQRG